MILITDNSIICPFEINAELMSTSMRITSDYSSLELKYRAIFDWMENNFEYELLSRKDKYKTSLETFYSRSGNCAELSFLYIVLARSSSLESKFVLVDKDCNEENVCHACATAGLVFVDPAYHCYDVRHSKYRIVDDCEASKIFQDLNRNS